MQTQSITPNAVPQEVPLSLLTPSSTNPRQHFNEEDLKELSETIRKSDVFQAILARPREQGLEIVFGERRYRASLLAGKETIPALVREMSDAEVLEAQLIELSRVSRRFFPSSPVLHVMDISMTCNTPIPDGEWSALAVQRRRAVFTSLWWYGCQEILDVVSQAQ